MDPLESGLADERAAIFPSKAGSDIEFETSFQTQRCGVARMHDRSRVIVIAIFLIAACIATVATMFGSSMHRKTIVSQQGDIYPEAKNQITPPANGVTYVQSNTKAQSQQPGSQGETLAKPIPQTGSAALDGNPAGPQGETMAKPLSQPGSAALGGNTIGVQGETLAKPLSQPGSAAPGRNIVGSHGETLAKPLSQPGSAALDENPAGPQGETMAKPLSQPGSAALGKNAIGLRGETTAKPLSQPGSIGLGKNAAGSHGKKLTKPLSQPGSAATGGNTIGSQDKTSAKSLSQPDQPQFQQIQTGHMGACWVEYYINYLGNDLSTKNNVRNAALCCELCADDKACFAWSWTKELICHLKGNLPRAQLTKIRDLNVTSGQPTQVKRSIPTVMAKPGQSLFCFALMIPFSYERALLAWQFSKGYNLFGCDEYAVYSNETIKVARGISTRTIAGSLSCKKGGEFGTALNTQIFLAVWARVVSDGRFKVHDWTVKVDPDCVFFPDRLRTIVLHHPEGPAGVYLNNCEHGLHGPLEVFSRNAVSAWWAGVPKCQQHFNQLCSGDCLWGEDMFIDQCLQKVLLVKREFEGHLLLEDHCDPPPDWMSCSNGSIVAFHPFKTVNRYKGCLSGVAPLQ